MISVYIVDMPLEVVIVIKALPADSTAPDHFPCVYPHVDHQFVII